MLSIPHNLGRSWQQRANNIFYLKILIISGDSYQLLPAAKSAIAIKSILGSG